jgi:biopolymer transport protein TolR
VARSRRRRRERPNAEINIINLVDVIMVLLVTFMIVAPMLKQGLAIDLPTARVSDSLSSEDKVILVECDTNLTIRINHEEVVLGGVEQKIRDLRQEYGEVPVQVRADREVPYGDLVGLWGEIRAAGVKSIAIELTQITHGK